MLINGYSVISTQCFSELKSHLSIFKDFWSSLNGSFCVSPGCHDYGDARVFNEYEGLLGDRYQPTDFIAV